MSQIPNPQELSAQAMSMYFASDEAKGIQRHALQRKARAAQKPLRWLACSHTILALLFYMIAHTALARGYPAAVEMQSVLAMFAIAFWMIWAWSINNPLVAAITGLLLYVSVVCIFLLIEAGLPASQVHAPPIGIFGIINICLLTRAIMNGSRQRRLEIAESQSAPGSAVRAGSGIASAIWLFLALLVIVMIPRAVGLAHNGNFDDVLKIHILLAIVVTTWAIASWRDTLPSLMRWPEARWFGQAFIIGIATCLLAMIYFRILNRFIGGQVADPAGIFFEHGFGWVGAIGMVAVFPAVFEELAFRGIIVPVLCRALSKWETILASGIMFMLLHLSVFSFPHLLCLGFALAYVRIRTGSIWPCMLMHFTHNLLCLWIK